MAKGEPKNVHKNVVRSFSGVGLFYNEEIASIFNIKVIDKEINDVLSVLFTYKDTEFKMVITTCYLPPESSRWGRDSTQFFTHILGETYTYEDVDIHICLGDLNARIGKLKDTIDDIDDEPQRIIIDDNINTWQSINRIFARKLYVHFK